MKSHQFGCSCNCVIRQPEWIFRIEDDRVELLHGFLQSFWLNSLRASEAKSRNTYACFSTFKWLASLPNQTIKIDGLYLTIPLYHFCKGDLNIGTWFFSYFFSTLFSFCIRFFISVLAWAAIAIFEGANNSESKECCFLVHGTSGHIV